MECKLMLQSWIMGRGGLSTCEIAKEGMRPLSPPSDWILFLGVVRLLAVECGLFCCAAAMNYGRKVWARLWLVAGTKPSLNPLPRFISPPSLWCANNMQDMQSRTFNIHQSKCPEVQYRSGVCTWHVRWCTPRVCMGTMSHKYESAKQFLFEVIMMILFLKIMPHPYKFKIEIQWNLKCSNNYHSIILNFNPIHKRIMLYHPPRVIIRVYTS